MSGSASLSPSPWRAEVAATLSLGWPMILTNLAQVAMGTIDTVMMGWLGPRELAAGTLAFNLFLAAWVLGIGLASAVAPLLAQCLGRRLRVLSQCRRVVAHGAWVVLIYVLGCWLVLWQADRLLIAMGQDVHLSVLAGQYMHALQWSLLPALWVIVLRSFIAALERPRAGMVISWLAVGLHVFSNWALMFGNLGAQPLGMVGAGVSSTLSFLFMLVAMLAFIGWDRRFRRFHLLGALWGFDWQYIRDLLRVGIPMALAMGFEVTGFNVAALMMGLISPQAVAAHAVALQVASDTFMVPLGLGQAATIRVGLAAGAGDSRAAGRAGWTALILGVGFMAVMAVVLLLAPLPIVHLFMDARRPDTQEVIALAVQFLAIVGMFQVMDGTQVVGAGALRGLKDTRVPMLFAGFGYWLIAVPLGMVLAFPLGWGGVGIWTGLAVGLGIVATLMLGRWARRDRLGLTIKNL